MKPTEQQSKAINSPHNIPAVVTAAAGSGKTTLLIGRIMRLLSDKELNIPADSLAIMTFTRNAADNLRRKLSRELSARLEELSGEEDSADERSYLSEQMIRLRSASIGTIDSFCINVIRENAQIFELPISFTVADSAKKAAMQAAAMEQVMAYFYGTIPDENGDFLTADDRNKLFYTFSFEDDSALRDKIISVSETLSSFEGSDKWLDDEAAASGDMQSMQSRYLPVFIESIRRKKALAQLHLEHIRTLTDELNMFFEQAQDSAKSSTDSDKIRQAQESYELYTEWLTAAVNCIGEELEQLEKENTLKALFEMTQAVAAKTAAPPKISQKGPRSPLRTQYTAARNELGDIISGIRDLPFTYESETQTLEHQRQVMCTFTSLVKLYGRCYRDIKVSSGLPDFSDCELLLLEKLRENESFRKQLSDRYSCIIVDEFQDSNNVQSEIFRCISRNGSNLFYVGDVKQAIYTFRGGNPKIMARLCEGEDGFEVIPLNKNFRSRRTIIDCVNRMFSGIMTKQFGDVDYEKDSQLDFGADYYPEIPDEKKQLYEAEIHMLNLKEEDAESDSELGGIRQAQFVAEKIQSMVQSGFEVMDENTHEMRRCRYSDFAVLLRKNAKIKAYREVMDRLGIPSLAPSGRDFLQSEEISLIMSLLSVIDNPLRDEELLKVLMSPIYRLSAEDAAKIRLGLLGYDNEQLVGHDTSDISQILRYFSLYGCLNYCVKADCDEEQASDIDTAAEAQPAYSKAAQTEQELSDAGIVRHINENAKRFMEDLKKYRFFMSNNSIESLIRKIYDDTEIFSIISAYEGSRQRIANVRLLQKYAADFEAREGGTLSDFIRFINNTKSFKQRMDEANVPEDAGNAVKIMTFHASKGLEMPVCILAELDFKFSQNDLRGTVMMNHDHGMALSYVDSTLRYKATTLSCEALKLLNRDKIYGEELRLLYVAMTRAQEKLIMVGECDKEPNELMMNERLTETAFASSSPFRWILASMLRYSTSEQRCLFAKDSPLSLYNKDGTRFNTRIFRDFPNTADALSSEAEDEDKQAAPPAPEPDRDEVGDILSAVSFRYPFAEEAMQQEKYSVTELAHSGDAPTTDSIVYLTKPSFVSEQEQNAPAKGTKRRIAASGKEIGDAYHHLMEHFPLEKMRSVQTDEERAEIVSEAVDNLVERDKLTVREATLIMQEKVVRFFTSGIGRRMLRSDRVEREKAFYAELPARDVNPACDGSISLQGRTDMYFYEDGKIVLVDYKSDSEKSLAAEKHSYAQQLSIYSKILPEVTGSEVKQMYIYAFSTGEEIDVAEYLKENDG